MRPTDDPPADAKRIPEFTIVKVKLDGRQWTPALLEEWVKAPEGWVCRVRWSRYRAIAGRVTECRYFPFDASLIAPIAHGDLNPPVL